MFYSQIVHLLWRCRIFWRLCGILRTKAVRKIRTRVTFAIWKVKFLKCKYAELTSIPDVSPWLIIQLPMLSTLSRLAAASLHLQPACTFYPTPSRPNSSLLHRWWDTRKQTLKRWNCVDRGLEEEFSSWSWMVTFLYLLEPQVGKACMRCRNEEVPVAQHWNLLCWSVRHWLYADK